MNNDIKGFAQVVGLSDDRLRYYKRILSSLNVNSPKSSIVPASDNIPLVINTDYFVDGEINTCEFVLPQSSSDGITNILINTGSTPNISFSSSNNIYIQEDFEIEANSIYEISIRAFNSSYYIVCAKMVEYE